jgi:hypothetical protein
MWAEQRAAEMGHADEEGLIYMLSKRVTEEDASTGFNVASAAFKKRHPTRRAPAVAYNGLPDPCLRWFITSMHECARSMRRRLARLLASNDTAVTSEGRDSPDPQAALSTFLSAHPEWALARGDCTLAFWELPSVLAALALRLQLSGLWFLNAPLVAAHYAVNLRSSTVHLRVLDITAFMRCHIGDGGTARYLFSDSGGDAESVLLQVLQPARGASEAELRSFSYNSVSCRQQGPKLRALVKRYGPGVVTSFRAELALAAPKTSYSGRHTSEFNGLHALILLGVRRDAASGKHFMLLQNSCASLPFFEVDEDYWVASKAKVHFIVTPQTAPPAGFITNDLISAESGVVGAGVAYPPLVRR